MYIVVVIMYVEQTNFGDLRARERERQMYIINLSGSDNCLYESLQNVERSGQ